MNAAELLSRLNRPEAVMDELVRKNFVCFLLRAFPTIRGGAALELNWHIDAIAYELARVSDGRSKRLLLTLPPRQLKSFMTSVAWVAWQLGLNPRLSFVCVSYSNELSAKFARDCRAIMQSEWYRRTFPGTIITPSRTAVHDFETSVGGGRLATSTGGTLTGRGGDIIILDDVLKPDEANSEVAREAVNDWFSTTLASRLNDKKSGAIIAVMQRLHQYDLAGMLLETGEWNELSLPAIASEDSVIPLTRGRVHDRREGDPLHPGREPLSVLEQIRTSIGSTTFAAQYQQQPLPAKGNIIKAEWLKTYSDLPERGIIVQSWDTACKTDERHDWSVCITARVDGRKASIVDVWRERVEFTDLWKAVQRLSRQWHPSSLLVEDAGNGTALIQRLRNEKPAGVPSPIARKPKLEKVARLDAASSMVEAGDLLLPKDAHWLHNFKAELLGFPSTRHDDQVDALSQLMNWVDQRESNRVPICTPIVLRCHSNYRFGSR